MVRASLASPSLSKPVPHGKAVLDNQLHFLRVNPRGHHTPKKSDRNPAVALNAYFPSYSKAERRPSFLGSLTSSLPDFLHPLGGARCVCVCVILRCAHRKLWELESSRTIQHHGKSPGLQFPSCVSLGQLHHSSGPQCFYLSNGGDNSLPRSFFFYLVCVRLCNLCKSTLKTKKA